MIAQLADTIRTAAAQQRPLRVHGGNTKRFYGQAVEGEPLDVRAYGGVVDYEPSELVITVRAGTPLAEVERLLAEHHQMLAFEPPHYGAAATIGGAVASGLSGPRRQAVGAVRDFVLGVRMLDGRGEDLSFGGRVMKNVAGYDVSRLMAGALGTLGVLTEISLKVLPQPQAEATLRFEMPEAVAIQNLNNWAARPLPISASAWQDGELHLRLSGAQVAIDAACARLGGERIDDAGYWQSVRDHTAPFFRADGPLWRVSLPSVARPLELPGAQFIEWGGALRWLVTQADARTVRAAAEARGGHATLFRGGDEETPVFHPLPRAVLDIHRRLKAEFDPHGILNPGRMYRGL
ncbi:MAG TPA: glycolate oxidase subunit GlcE [Burkholderiales bacterium]|nr:glycolate oxidase subunit GlcE [Burkholderiales bacterium]